MLKKMLQALIRPQNKPSFSWLTWVFPFLLGLVLAISPLYQAGAQTPPLPSPESSAEIVYAPITLDGRQLFLIAAPEGETVNSNLQIPSPLEMRVGMYEENLTTLLSQGFDPGTFSLELQEEPEQVILLAQDNQELERQTLLTLTPLDAEIHGLTLGDFSQQVQQILASALLQAQQERQPSYLQQQALFSSILLLGLLLISAVIIFWYRRLQKQGRKLEEQQPAAPEITTEEACLEFEQQKIAWLRRHHFNQLKKVILLLGIFFLWVVGLAWIAGLFPYTRFLQDWLLTKPQLLAIILGTNLAIKGSNVLLDYFFRGWSDRYNNQLAPSPRQLSRITTFYQVVKEIFTFCLIFLGALLFLHKLHVPIGPVLAGAGIIGFAISFSSQSLIRDIINGILIIWEDQFAVGDVVDVGEASGGVEAMNLRTTQIRGTGGRLSTVPNSRINTVHNLTKHWSRVDMTIEVSHDSDVDRALAIVKEVGEGMQQDPDWAENVIDPTNVLGVNDLSHEGVQILLWFKTAPGAQFSLGREFRRRLKLAFDEEGIAIGVPKQSLWLENSPAWELLNSSDGDGNSSAMN